MTSLFDISEKNQWLLVEKYYEPGRTCSRAQFCRDNNFPDTSELPEFGKYHTQLRKKIMSVEGLSSSERSLMIKKGLCIKEAEVKPPEIEFCEHLIALANMPAVYRKHVIAIMKDLEPAALPGVMSLIP